MNNKSEKNLLDEQDFPDFREVGFSGNFGLGKIETFQRRKKF
jgi:hypothetical protein